MQVTVIVRSLARHAEALDSLRLLACGLGPDAGTAVLQTWAQARALASTPASIDLSYNPLGADGGKRGGEAEPRAASALAQAVEQAAPYATRLDFSFTGLALQRETVAALAEAWRTAHFGGQLVCDKSRLVLSADVAALAGASRAADENVQHNRQSQPQPAQCATSEQQPAIDQDDIAYLLAGLEDEGDSVPLE